MVLQVYPPKSTSYRSECELFGSYVSLDCPSPPAPPSGPADARRDPQVSIHYIQMADCCLLENPIKKMVHLICVAISFIASFL